MSVPKNLSNPEAVDTALKQLQDGKRPDVQKWLGTAAKRHLLEDVACFRRLGVADVLKAYKTKPWMLKAYPKGSAIWEFDSDDPDFQQFVEDLELATAYVESLVVSGRRVGAELTFDRAVTEGTRLREQLAVEKARQERPEDKKLVHRYSNGFAWWSLLTQRALQNESLHMNHCVGNFGGDYYFRKIQSGSTQILSLRDAEDIPHVTLELEDQYLRQCKGNSNGEVGPKYRSAVIGLLKDMIQEQKILRVHVADLGRSDITPGALNCRWDEEGWVRRQ